MSECLATHETSLRPVPLNSYSPKTQGQSQKRSQKKDPEVRKEWSGPVSSGRDQGAALRDSQQLWLPAQDLLRSVNILTWRES